MKANASGTPAKLEATPEKVTRKVRSDLGQAAQDHRIRQEKAEQPPPMAVIRLMLRLVW